MDLVHSTPVEGGVVGAVCGFKGRLLAGVGPTLRMYEMGKKKMLRKCEYNRWVRGQGGGLRVRWWVEQIVFQSTYCHVRQVMNSE